MKIKDQLHNELILANVPKRIISLVPSQTELLVALGLENQLVGITKFCIHPAHLKQHKTVVGGTKNVDLKKIAMLHPDIIICNKEENTQELVEKLRPIAPVYISDIYTINDTLEMITSFGVIFKSETTAQKIINQIKLKHSDFQTFIKQYPSKKVAYFIWSKPWMVAGASNFINTLLELNKFENCYINKGRYPEIELTSLKSLAPDLVLLSSEPFPFKEIHALQIKEYTNAKIIYVDGELFSWYGSRLLSSFDYFKKLHYSLDKPE